MLRSKIRLRLILANILGIIMMVCILGFAYLNNKLIETLISIICFYIFRKLFTKQYHSFSSLKCTFISIVIYSIIVLLELNITESILFSVILTFLVNLGSYYFRDYLDNRNELKYLSDKMKKMGSKRLEEYTEEELLRLFPNIKADTIHIVYGYLHKDKGITANEYAYKYNISEPLIYKYLKQVKDEYRKLINE